MPTRREALKALAGLAWKPTTPGTRAGHALAYHAGLNATCLIGGDAQDGPDTRLWLWNGSTWTQRAQKDAPPTTSLVVAVSDLDRRSILTFGGFPILARNRYGPPTGDLWELSANGTWRKHATDGTQPGPRHHHAAAFDSARGRLVLYGGIDDRDRWSTDVWEWDRQRWHRIQTTNGPGERAHHAMAFDTKRKLIVLRGGTRSNRDRPTDTWEWDGTTWRQAATDGPDPGGGYRLAYDGERAVTMMFGGNTCLWDGTRWTRAETTPAPPARSVHALAYDPSRKRTLLYGGTINNDNAADTWEWDGARWLEMRPR